MPGPTAAPTPTPTAAPDLYVPGGLSWSFAGDIPDAVRPGIRDAMDWAINHTNTLADYRGMVTVTYNAGTPTAEAGYQWRIQFGGAIGRRVALHELAHWLGSGTYSGWRALLAEGRFTGPIATARVKAFEGPDAVLNADGQHFWPYGLNYDREFVDPQRNVAMVAAQRADMGLSDGAAAIAGTRRFVNRSSSLWLDGRGTAPAASATGQDWTVAYADGFVTLAEPGGRRIDSLGATADGAATGLAAASGQPAQQWEMMPTDGGWFLLRNRLTGKCLDNVGELSGGAPIRVWSCGGHPNQQWHLAR
ncbi:hypothetical protein GCM10011380_16690 [Sphingomonas metalli]|uniref:Ricin B lectin domain-containing protein n=2 Tax=Sphingomonas metalli TaxID=1779358 RepID=A0A916WTA3_9SPHN|nr:hypothetical protein GCM10011380_16690 [Sphingomonas metalli]